MSLAERMKMFEQAAQAANVGTPMKTQGVKRNWGVCRGPSVADTIKQISANDPSLVHVDLSNAAAFQCKPEEYTHQLASALKNNNHVKELKLENCSLGDKEAEILAEGLMCNTCIQHLDLQKNHINNDGGSALAKGLSRNRSLLSIDLMSQGKTRWGDKTLDDFLDMFQHNITLLKINWRLESRKSFALNKMITRNNEIDRRRKLNMHFDDLLPASLRPAPADGGGSEGMSNVPAGKGGDEPMFDCSEDGKENYPAPLLQPSREPSPGILGGIPTPSSSSPMTAPLNSRPPSQDMHVKPLSSESLHNSANGAVGGVAGQINAFARINELNKMSKPTIQHEHRAIASGPLPGVPKVKRASPSVLARWPPAQFQE